MASSSPVDAAFAVMVQRARYGKGMAQRTLAGLCGLSNGVVFRLEGRGHNVSLRTAVALARELGLDLNELKEAR